MAESVEVRWDPIMAFEWSKVASSAKRRSEALQRTVEKNTGTPLLERTVQIVEAPSKKSMTIAEYARFERIVAAYASVEYELAGGDEAFSHYCKVIEPALVAEAVKEGSIDPSFGRPTAVAV